MLQLPYYIELGWKLKKDLHIHREQEEGNYQVKVLHKKNYVLPLSLTVNNEDENENEDENLKQLSSFIFPLST